MSRIGAFPGKLWFWDRIDSSIVAFSDDGMTRKPCSLIALASSVDSEVSRIANDPSLEDSEMGKSERSRSSTWKEI
jgi:hypothetical protein